MNDDHLKAFMAATKTADNACRELVRDELRQLLALAEQSQAIAGANLNRAYQDLQQARKPIAALEAEIAEAETEAEEWAKAHVSDELGARVAAHVWQQQFADELTRLRDKLSGVQISIAPFETEHAAAKREFREAAGEVELLRTNLIDPFIGYGQSTEAYKLYRCQYGSVVRVLEMTNEANFEWASAVNFLRELAELAGFDLVENSERLTKAAHDELLRDYRAKHANDDRPEVKIGEAGNRGSPGHRRLQMADRETPP